VGAIAGVVMSRPGRPLGPALGRQAAALGRRARGIEAIWEDGQVGLVHRATDSCGAEIQPARDPTGRFVMVCDGGIYNVRELGSALAESGVPPVASMLGLMLQALVEWGPDAFRRFNGAFACAIWDAAEGRLLLARDHVGIKPLHYAMIGETLVFASDAKAVLAHPDCPSAPDEARIASYLTFNPYLFQGEASFYRGVRRVPPAHVLSVGRTGAQPRAYWRLDPALEGTRPIDEDEIAAIGALATDAVRIRMPAGDRLGAALTGGLDSSSIVGMLRQLDTSERAGRATIDTFSFDFGTGDADELDLIDLVARRTGARHHHLTALASDLLTDLDDAIRASDGPTLEAVVLLLWRKKRLASCQGIQVLLSGLGGDEVFMGTRHYLADLLAQGRWLELARQIGGIYPRDPSTGQPTSLGELLRAYVLSPLMPAWLRRARRVQFGRVFPPPWIPRTLAIRTGLLEGLPAPPGPGFRTAGARAAWELLWCEVAGGVLPYQDACSAAFAIETRFPYLDVRLIEASFSVDRRWKMDRGEVRLLQKRALAAFLPLEVLQTHVKKNFHGALNAFLRGLLATEMEGLIARRGPRSRDYVNWEDLRGRHAAYIGGRVDDPSALWGVLNLERWLETVWG